MSDKPVLCIFTEMAEYALDHGFKAPCFIKVDERWSFAVTGKEPGHFGPEKGMDIDIPAYSWAVWFNGWIAGVGNPYGGEIAAGDAANEVTFSQAIGGKYHTDTDEEPDKAGYPDMNADGPAERDHRMDEARRAK